MVSLPYASHAVELGDETAKIVAISSFGRCGHIVRGLGGVTDGSRDHEFRGDSRGRPRFFGAGCHVWWSLQWCCRCGNVENCGRGAVALRGVVRGKTRQVYFRAELGFLEGTPLCPCLIQVLRACTLGTCTRHNFGHTSAHLYLWRAVESTGLLAGFFIGISGCHGGYLPMA